MLLRIRIVYRAVAVAAGIKLVVYEARMLGLFTSVLSAGCSDLVDWSGVNTYLVILASSKAETRLACAHYGVKDGHEPVSHPSRGFFC